MNRTLPPGLYTVCYGVQALGLISVLLMPVHAHAAASDLLFEAQPLRALQPQQQATANADADDRSPAASAVTPFLQHAAFASKQGQQQQPLVHRDSAPLPALPADEREEIESMITDMKATIDETTNAAGPWASALARQYVTLGQFYLQADDHANAQKQFGKAEHIFRVNFGLNAPEQYVPVELSIASHLANGEFQQAIDRQEYLVYLHQSRYGANAIEAVPALMALGDMYFAAFERGMKDAPGGTGLTMRFGPQSAYVDPDRLTSADISFLWLYQAQLQYFRSISNLLTHHDYFNPLLVDLENSLIETLFLQSRRPEMEVDAEFFMGVASPRIHDVLRREKGWKRLPRYQDGTEAFSRILTYLQHNPDPEPARVANAMLELGDWHVLFGRHRLGMDEYRKARTYLQANGTSAAEIDRLLSPEVPVQLPAFLEQPNTIDALSDAEAQAVTFDGYIDVEFSLDGSGAVSELEVLGKSHNADSAVESRLKKVLYNAPFRPRITAASDTEKSERIALRYRFARR